MTAQPIPDTFRTVQQELALFGGSVLLGIPSGIFLDGFRLFRRCVRHPALAAAVEDALWLLGTAVLLLCYASACAKGVFRVYYAVGCLLGLIVYELTLGEPTVRLLYGLWKILCLPFQLLGRWFSLIFTKINIRFARISQSCSKNKENIENNLQAHGKKVYNKCRHQWKGNAHGKNKTSDPSSTLRSASAPAGSSGAVYRRLYHCVHQHTECDHREKTGDGGTQGKHRVRHRTE